MKTYSLKIKQGKTRLNEVEVGIDQIAKTTGIGDTASALTQLAKMASATVKLALGVVFSFRSLSIQKITENINQANKNYSRRVRSAMRSLDKTIDDLGSNSMASKAFAYTVPLIAVTDYVRKDIDNAGGLYNYLEDQSQNLLFGDIFSSVYNVYEEAIKKSMNLKGKDADLTEEELKRRMIEIIRKNFREEYGEEAVEVLNDILNERDTVRAQELIDIVNSDLVGIELQKAIYNYFERFRQNQPDSTTESFRVKKEKLIISEKKIKRKKYSEQEKMSVVAAIAELLDLQEKITNLIFESASNEEENLKNDIASYSIVLEILICDYTVFSLTENFISSKEIKEESVKSDIGKLSAVQIESDSKARINKFINDMFAKLEKDNKSDIAVFLSSSIEEIKKKNIYQNSKIKEYLDSLNEYSNSDDSNFTKLKKGVNNVYNKNASVNMDEVIKSLSKIVEELGKENEDNQAT